MPERLLGIDILTGATNRFPIRVRDERDEPFVMKLYRTRNFRASQDADRKDTVRYRITQPDGTVLQEDAMSGTQYAAHVVRVARDGQRGDYGVTIECVGDGQGAFSCSLPTMFLDARQRFRFRRIRGGTGFAQFAFRAPRGRRAIAMKLTWSDAPAQGTGVWVRDMEGNVVAHRRWMAPMGTVFDENGRELGLVDRLELPIPEPYRGRVLPLTIMSAKWMGWQIEGLEEPWLGATPEAFGE